MEKKFKFSEKIGELEKIVEKINSDIEIEEALALYEKGVKLAGSIKTHLAKAEKKVEILTEEGLREVEQDDVGKNTGS